MKLHRYVDHQRLHIVTKYIISLSISVLLLFRHYISHKITFGAPSSGGVLRSACGAFIIKLVFWAGTSMQINYSIMLCEFTQIFSVKFVDIFLPIILHMYWVLKRTVSLRWFFEYPQHIMRKLFFWYALLTKVLVIGEFCYNGQFYKAIIEK